MTKLGKRSISTNTAVLSYSSLFEPKENLSSKLVYSCTLLFKKSAKNKRLYKAYSECLRANQVQVADCTRDSIQDGDLMFQRNPEIYHAYENTVYIRCSSVYAPVLADLRGSGAEVQESDLFDGCKVRALVAPFCYQCGNNIGVSWSLISVGLVTKSKRTEKLRRALKAFGKLV
jgi:hypothetical protein